MPGYPIRRIPEEHLDLFAEMDEAIEVTPRPARQYVSSLVADFLSEHDLVKVLEV